MDDEGGRGREGGEGEKKLRSVREREDNLIFSLLRRTLVGLEKLIHAPSPPLVTLREKETASRAGGREGGGKGGLSAESGHRVFSPRKLAWLQCQ